MKDNDDLVADVVTAIASPLGLTSLCPSNRGELLVRNGPTEKVYFHRNQVLEHLYLAGCHLWCGPGWQQECAQSACKLHQKKPVEQGCLRGRKAGELLETVFFLFS